MNEIDKRKIHLNEYSSGFSYIENKSNLKIIYLHAKEIISSKVILLSIDDKIFTNKILKKKILDQV